MFEWIDNLEKKQIRLILGIVMMYSFLALIYSLYFFVKVSVQLDQGIIVGYILALLAYPNFWMPSVGLIVLTYLLLTKVFKYEKEERKK